jgi:hypothetical protein
MNTNSLYLTLIQRKGPVEISEIDALLTQAILNGVETNDKEEPEEQQGDAILALIEVWTVLHPTFKTVTNSPDKWEACDKHLAFYQQAAKELDFDPEQTWDAPEWLEKKGIPFPEHLLQLSAAAMAKKQADENRQFAQYMQDHLAAHQPS